MIFRRVAILLLSIHLIFSDSPANGPLRSASDIRLALKRLGVVGSVLYVAAHPDDENTALLATLARGRGYRTGYLSLTRGEGGQNLIGDEQGQLLGMIRTQELLAARRIDGAEQWFTRAIDFGYSKTSTETMRIWNEREILGDIVRVIRTFRPDVIITRFSPTAGGHGNHTASAILTEQAFAAAADPSAFPEQQTSLRTWQATRLVWNAFRPSAADSSWHERMRVRMDVGEYSPVLGKSFSELAGEARSMHKSQGFGAAQNRGSMLNYFQHVAGVEARADLFDGITMTWSRFSGGGRFDSLLTIIREQFNDEVPERSVPHLMELLHVLDRLPDASSLAFKRHELIEIIRACSGLWFEASAADHAVSPGTLLTVSFVALNRSNIPWVLDHVLLPFGSDSTLRIPLENNVPLRRSFTCSVPETTPITEPYWQSDPRSVGAYSVRNTELIGQPESPTPFRFVIRLTSPHGTLPLEIEAQHKRIDPVSGEVFRPLLVVPPVTAVFTEPVVLAGSEKPRVIDVALRAYIPQVTGTIRLLLPKGWGVSPREQPFTLNRRDEETVARFMIAPTASARSGILSAQVDIGGKVYDRGVQSAAYDHIPPQLLFTSAQGRIIRSNISVRGSRIGYIMGAGDDIPTALKQMGYTVTLLDDAELATGTLSTYDAIVAGIRAYNTRPSIRAHQKRLMDYVHQGGTLVVQYVTTQRGESENIGPFPLTISRDRVTEEDAELRFLAPSHPLLNRPNVITQGDFSGWVQERGLYYAGTWDSRYVPILAAHDEGESESAGGLLAAEHGKGIFIYTGLSFFRQLPAGVEGAYRLFANLVSARATDTHGTKGQPQ
ncbi:MAG: PIG-L family deacetylase [Bacteroidetes bacterium]|nr:PIG-L family deacetylase [Bacteroidota bacterium]